MLRPKTFVEIQCDHAQIATNKSNANFLWSDTWHKHAAFGHFSYTYLNLIRVHFGLGSRANDNVQYSQKLSSLVQVMSHFLGVCKEINNFLHIWWYGSMPTFAGKYSTDFVKWRITQYHLFGSPFGDVSSLMLEKPSLTSSLKYWCQNIVWFTMISISQNHVKRP